MIISLKSSDYHSYNGDEMLLFINYYNIPLSCDIWRIETLIFIVSIY